MHSFKLTTFFALLLLLIVAVVADDSKCGATNKTVKKGFKKQRHTKHSHVNKHKQHHHTTTSTHASVTTTPSGTSSTQSAPTTSQSAAAGLSADDSTVLNLHNTKRATLNGAPLTWSNTLADYAHDYASKCAFEHSHGPYGENLSIGGPFSTYTANQLFMMWWDEGKMCDYSRSDACNMSSGAGHYVNIINEKYKKLGCAVVKCPASTMGGNTQGIADSKYLVCEYQ